VLIVYVICGLREYCGIVYCIFSHTIDFSLSLSLSLSWSFELGERVWFESIESYTIDFSSLSLSLSCSFF
jgi:hypothetical protein